MLKKEHNKNAERSLHVLLGLGCWGVVICIQVLFTISKCFQLRKISVEDIFGQRLLAEVASSFNVEQVMTLQDCH